MATPAGEVTIYFNPSCSKCRTARSLLADEGIVPRIVSYLEDPPTVEDLRHLMRQLGIGDPRQMMRTSEAVYAALGLAERSGDDLLEAMAAHPVLLERPIVVRGDRAVIARPPDRLEALLHL